MKIIFGFLLLLIMALFAFMQWGGALTGASRSGLPQGELNPEKIKLQEMFAAKLIPGSELPPLLKTIAVSAPPATSAPVPTTASTELVPASAVSVSAPVLASAVAVSMPLIAPLAKATAIKVCMEWGEFSGTDLKAATKALAGMKLGDRLTQRTVEYASGYWVYIPPIASRAARIKKIEQIKTAGVTDYFVVQEGRKWINAISLGVFKTRAAAINFQAGLQRKGLRTSKVGERKSKLIFTVFALSLNDVNEKNHLVALQKYFASSELKIRPCHKQ